MRFFATTIIALLWATVTLAQVSVERSTKIVTIGTERFYSHTVQKKQTIYSIARAYNLPEEAILENNPRMVNGLKAKEVILIPTRETYLQQLQKKTHFEPEPTPTEEQKTIENQVDTTATQPEIIEPQIPTLGPTRDFDPRSVIRVAILLPFDGENPSSGSNRSYVEFFNGSLMAIEELKKQGYSVEVDVITFGDWATASERSNDQQAHTLIESGRFEQTNLIIGPVLSKDLLPFVEWATANRVPIVSSMAQIGDIESPYLFQGAPCERNRFEKLKPLIQNNQANVVVIRTDRATDEEFLEEIKTHLPEKSYVMRNVDPKQIRTLGGIFETGKENVVILPLTSETAVSTILERIDLLNSSSRYRVTVIGLSRWSRFTSLNVGTLFKLDVKYITNYHEDRNEQVINGFYARYITRFMNTPSLFSMRGYDITKLFIGSLREFGPEMPIQIDGYSPELLQVKYRFKQSDPSSSFRNSEWILVNYTPEQRIVVE